MFILWYFLTISIYCATYIYPNSFASKYTVSFKSVIYLYMVLLQNFLPLLINR